MKKRSRGVKLECASCHIGFNVFTTIKKRASYFCPICGESNSTRSRTIFYPTGIRKTSITWWDEKQIIRLIQLYNEGKLTMADIGAHLGRTRRSVESKLNRLREQGRVGYRGKEDE